MRNNQEISPVAGVPLFRRIISGGGDRPTRFHDNLGKRVTLARFLRNGTRAFAGGILRLTLGWRPNRPWISYDAQSIIARFLTPDSTVLEFGSGRSTLWFAQHARRVVSIEDNADWYRAIEDSLNRRENVEYHFADSPAAYVALAPNETFDLYMIDGHWREECVKAVLETYRPGSIIYLDNSDKGDNPETTGNIPSARKLLIDFARNHSLQVREFTDFSPTQFFAERGLMVGPD